MAKQEKENADSKAIENKIVDLQKKTTLISGAEYWKFDENPIFTGIYDSPVKREQDAPDGEGKAGDLIGFNFTDETDETWIIGNSYAIEKALLMEVEGKKVMDLGKALEIEFLGKGVNSKNQPFNRFKISLLE